MNMVSRPKFSHLCTGLLSVLLGVLMMGGLLLWVQPASADTVQGNVCMQTLFGSKLNCTANDVSVAKATSVSQNTCIAGEKFDLTATFQVNTTATTRYDIGLYFDIAGDLEKDGAKTGTCSLSTLPTTGPGAEDYDHDFCGDTSSAHSPRFVTITFPQVTCADTTGDGFLSLPNCVSWRNNAGDACNKVQDAFPGTTSKCKCDAGFKVPVHVTKGGLSVTKAAVPTSVNEPSGSVTFTVTVTNTGDASVTLNTIEDDIDNDPLTANTNVYQASAICAATLLAPSGQAGSSTTCSFIRTVSGNAGQTFTDSACAKGTDSHGSAVSACNVATVTVQNVDPNADVTKTVQGTVCATVRYAVSVKNTDPAEAVTLTKLCDDKFGTIVAAAGSTCAAGSEGSIKATTCVAGTSIASGATSTCTFDAEVCAKGHTDTVTATVSDDDGNSVAKSGSVTVTDAPGFLQ
jgi:hypothetical protein